MIRQKCTLFVLVYHNVFVSECGYVSGLEEKFIQKQFHLVFLVTKLYMIVKLYYQCVFQLDHHTAFT